MKYFKLRESAKDLNYATSGSACFDISVCLEYGSTIKAYTQDSQEIDILVTGDNEIRIPNEWRVLIPTGIILDIPRHHHVKIYSRSGLSVKKGLTLANNVGIIDEDYVEELLIPIVNRSASATLIKHGDRIAQGELCITCVSTVLGQTFERPSKKTNREGGFGSTGII
jgi:dUTP pyrophosphatase